MASRSDRRESPRRAFKAPIAYARTRRQRFHGAKMTDCSADGIRFVSELALRPGAEVMVRTIDPSSAKEASEAYRAEIVWCNRFLDNDVSWYLVGARFTGHA
ncbi:MAG: PilZ domain-containing protein [Desulfobacterales bacterium]|nr:PilZ domain-containing protein [Desulfobacterales bacterium]